MTGGHAPGMARGTQLVFPRKNRERGRYSHAAQRHAPLLSSLHIQGFRAFQDLQVPYLGRVNLIVGKNNVGKTTLLEALKMYAAGTGALMEMGLLLARRQEIQRIPPNEERSYSFDLQRAFFTASKDAPQGKRVMSIGPMGLKEQTLVIRLGWRWRAFARAEGAEAPRPLPVFSEQPPDGHEEEEVEEAVRIEFSARTGHTVTLPSLLDSFSRSWRMRAKENEGVHTCHYVPARGLERLEIGKLWDAIVLTAQEQQVLQALQIIAPDVERISLIDDPHEHRGERLALVLKRFNTIPEPLSSMGDGMNRVFELALGLVNSRAGIFLVDEFENGVHYSAQEQLWRFVFEASNALGVQIFATTHSWDCIEAFQRAASAHKEAGALIRLALHDEQVRANVFNERDLEILTRESIEVR